MTSSDSVSKIISCCFSCFVSDFFYHQMCIRDRLTPHPWDALDANLQVGDKVKGKVVVMADYGAFIEIDPGVEGLIHVSEMFYCFNKEGLVKLFSQLP